MSAGSSTPCCGQELAWVRNATKAKMLSHRRYCSLSPELRKQLHLNNLDIGNKINKADYTDTTGVLPFQRQLVEFTEAVYTGGAPATTRK